MCNYQTCAFTGYMRSFTIQRSSSPAAKRMSFMRAVPCGVWTGVLYTQMIEIVGNHAVVCSGATLTSV